MLDSKIGYIICETASSEPQKAVVISEKNNRVVIEARLQDMEVKNRNGRYYSKSELEPELTSARMVELIESGNAFGEAGHPMSKDISRQQTVDPTNVSHRLMKLWAQGNDIMAHVKGTPNMRGQEFNDFILDDTKVSFSLRALGSVENTKRGAEVKNIRIICWDWVVFPSHKRAYMTGIVNESAIVDHRGNKISSGNKFIVEESDKGLITPITNPNVINFIKNESANIKNILESFDVDYNSATLLENGKQVQIGADNGDTMVINLENYVSEQLMNYAYKY